MLTQHGSINQIYASSLPANIRILPGNLALHWFRETHPADLKSTKQQELSSAFDDYNLLYIPEEFLEHAVQITQGPSKHYFSGLLYAHFTIKQVANASLSDCASEQADPESARAMVVNQLVSICKTRYETLYTRPYAPYLAFDFAVLETATFMLVHLEPNLGKTWVNKLYNL